MQLHEGILPKRVFINRCRPALVSFAKEFTLCLYPVESRSSLLNTVMGASIVNRCLQGLTYAPYATVTAGTFIWQKNRTILSKRQLNYRSALLVLPITTFRNGFYAPCEHGFFQDWRSHTESRFAAFQLLPPWTSSRCVVITLIVPSTGHHARRWQ